MLFQLTLTFWGKKALPDDFLELVRCNFFDFNVSPDSDVVFVQEKKRFIERGQLRDYEEKFLEFIKTSMPFFQKPSFDKASIYYEIFVGRKEQVNFNILDFSKFNNFKPLKIDLEFSVYVISKKLMTDLAKL